MSGAHVARPPPGLGIYGHGCGVIDRSPEGGKDERRLEGEEREKKRGGIVGQTDI